MRNLKRALSLALASVMLLGMMVVGTSAASYPDVDENDNVEAIEVLNAVNVMIGRQGNFEPDEAVKRHEMATIMAKLVLGVETADNYVGSHPYTDVVPWADKYVAACYENGLVYGKSATTYNGNDPLTAVEAAAMMLRALGYKDLNKGYQGDWRAPITAMANQIRLFDGVASNPNEKLNRNQVAQLALNTLKSPMVNLKDNTFDVTNGDGQVVISGGSREYIVLSSQEAYARAINDVESKGTSASAIGGYTVELGEHLYNGKLKLNNNYLDDFGRPARHWEYDGKKIGSYIKEELMVMDKVDKVTGKDLYDLLGASTIKDYSLDVYVDGINDPAVYDAIPNAVDDTELNTHVVFNKTDLNRNNKAAVGATGTGVQTQVFVDPNYDNGGNNKDGRIWIAVINTYLAIADKAYDEKKEEASIKVYDLSKDPSADEYAKTKQYPAQEECETFKLGNEDFALVKDIAKDDPYLVTVAAGAIQTIVPAEVISNATISAFKRGDHVVSGGTTYKYTTTAGYNYGDLRVWTSEDIANLKEITYNIYLDAYGNLIGLKENDAVKNYVFLTGIDRNGSYTSNTTATANAVFLDGTSETIKINMAKSKWRPNRWDAVASAPTSGFGDGAAMLNTWCTYSKNGDLYTVREVWNVATPNASGAAVKPGDTDKRAPGAGSGDAANSTNLAQFHDTTLSEITLKNGLRLPGGYPVGEEHYSAYGDSNSVYLTADLGTLENDGTKYGVIKGAETVHTGIDGTSISVWLGDDARNEANKDKNNIDLDKDNGVPGAGDAVSEGIYTLYDEEGIMIAAMVVGEGSSAQDLVYVHSSDLDLEEDNGGNAKAAGDGLWTWYRKVIRNGEEVTLTEVSDSADVLYGMKQYQWYQVKTDGNGNVTAAEEAYSALEPYVSTPNNERSVFVANYAQINEAVANEATDVVLYQTDGGPYDYAEGLGYSHNGFDHTKSLEVRGNNVLAVTNSTGSGIYFRNDVNVTLQYWGRNQTSTEFITGKGVEDLKDMVDRVNENTEAAIKRDGGRFNVGGKYTTYFVSALIKDGAATDIVIYDNFNNYSRPEDTTQYDQKLYLTGVLGGTFYNNNTSVFTVDANGVRTPVSVDKDWDTWNNTTQRYTIKSGSDVLIVDTNIDRDDYAPYFSSKATVTETLPLADGKIRFTMPKADVTIYDDAPGGEEGLTLTVDLTGKIIGKKGATLTGTINADGTVTINSVVQTRAGAIGTVAITIDANGEVTSIAVTLNANATENVIGWEIKSNDGTVYTSTLEEGDYIAPEEEATITPVESVAVETVAVATVSSDGTKVVCDNAEITDGADIVIVDEAGDAIGSVTVEGTTITVDMDDAAALDSITSVIGTDENDADQSYDITEGTGDIESPTNVYSVIVTPNDDVTVTSEPADLTGLAEGDEVTLTIVPKDPEREIESVIADPDVLTDNGDGTYTLTIGTANVTVTITTGDKAQATPKTVTFDFGATNIVLSSTQDDVTNLTAGESENVYTVDDVTAATTFKLDTSKAAIGQDKTVKVVAKVGNGQGTELTAENGVYTLAADSITDNVTITVTIESTQATPKTVTFDFGATNIVLSSTQDDVTNLAAGEGANVYTVTNAAQAVTFKLDTTGAGDLTDKTVKVVAKVGNGQGTELTAENGVYTLAADSITDNVTITVTIETA